MPTHRANLGGGFSEMRRYVGNYVKVQAASSVLSSLNSALSKKSFVDLRLETTRRLYGHYIGTNVVPKVELLT
jgi:hypothetical protein